MQAAQNAAVRRGRRLRAPRFLADGVKSGQAVSCLLPSAPADLRVWGGWGLERGGRHRSEEFPPSPGEECPGTSPSLVDRWQTKDGHQPLGLRFRPRNTIREGDVIAQPEWVRWRPAGAGGQYSGGD
jgi:hypothetical protein